MNSTVMLNRKTKPQVSSVKRRLDSIFGSYDKFSEIITGVGVSGTDEPIIFGRNAVADYPPGSSSSHQSQLMTRHGAESTRSSSSSRHSNAASSRQLTGNNSVSYTASGRGDEPAGRRPPSTTDVLQSMQGLIRDKLLTELDCSMNRNCLVKDQSAATTSEAPDSIEVPPRKRKHSGETQVEQILEQFKHVSPLLSPIRRPVTPPSAVYQPAASPLVDSRTAAKRSARKRDDDSDDPESKRPRHESSNTAAAAALRLVGEPQPLIKPLAGVEPKHFGISSTTTSAEPLIRPPVKLDIAVAPSKRPVVSLTLPSPPPFLTKDYDEAAIDPSHCRLVLSSLLPAEERAELREKWLRLRYCKIENIKHAEKKVVAVPAEDKENIEAKAIDKTVDAACPLYSVVVPSRYRSEWKALSNKVRSIWYESIDEFAALFRKPSAYFAGQRQVVVQLPDIEDAVATDAIIEAVEQLSHAAAGGGDWPDFLLIPPPPRLGTDFERVVDFLLQVRVPHIDANPTFRGRNLYSLGWYGVRLNDVHSRDGRWTHDGLYAIRQFLKSALRLDWLFRRKPKRTASRPSVDDLTSAAQAEK